MLVLTPLGIEPHYIYLYFRKSDQENITTGIPLELRTRSAGPPAAARLRLLGLPPRREHAPLN